MKTYKINKFVMLPEKKKSDYDFQHRYAGTYGGVGTYLWSILNISSTSKLLIFDLFGIARLKDFIVADNKKTINKDLKGTEKMDRTDQNLTL